MVRKVVSILSILLLANTVMYGQGDEIPQGRWNKVESEKPGTGIIVTLRGGEQLQSSLKSVSADTLTVVTLDATERRIPKSAVETIVTLEKRSGPLWNGAVIGAAIPGTLGIIALAGSFDVSGDDVAVVAIWTGIGAAIGMGIDAVIRGQITLYKAPKSGN